MKLLKRFIIFECPGDAQLSLVELLGCYILSGMPLLAIIKVLENDFNMFLSACENRLKIPPHIFIET